MKPALTDLLASARVVSLPLRTKFRGVVDREVMLFEGPNGWAEWSPFLEYPDEEAAVWLSAAIEFAYGSMPTLHRDRIAVNATLPAVAPDQVATVLARFGSFSTVKIKVAEPGQTPGQDVDRIMEVRKLYPEEAIAVERAIDRRQREFAAGRESARLAMRAIGWPDDSFPANAVVSERKTVQEAVVFRGFDQ